MATSTRKTVSAAALLEATTTTLKTYVAQCLEREGMKKRARAAQDETTITETQVKSALVQLHQIIATHGTMLLPAASSFAELFASLLRVAPRNALVWKAAAAFSTFATSMCTPLTEELLERILVDDIEKAVSADGSLGTDAASAAMTQLVVASGRHCSPTLIRRFSAALSHVIDGSKSCQRAYKIMLLAHPIVMVSSPPLPKLVSSINTLTTKVRAGLMKGSMEFVELLDVCNQLECIMFQRVHPSVIPFYVPAQVEGMNTTYHPTSAVQQSSNTVGNTSNFFASSTINNFSAPVAAPAPVDQGRLSGKIPTPKVISAQASPRVTAQPTPAAPSAIQHSATKAKSASKQRVGSNKRASTGNTKASPLQKAQKAPSEEFVIPDIFDDEDAE